MSKDVDTKLADFTEKLMSGANPEELLWAPEDHDLHNYQKLVMSLYKFAPTQSAKKSEDRILSTLKKNWDTPKTEKPKAWKSPRKRNSAYAFAFAFAVIVVAVIIFPSLPSGEASLPGAAQGGSIFPVLITLIGIAAIAFLLFGRNSNGKK